MKCWIKQQIAAGAYRNASEYIRALIERDQLLVTMLDQLRTALHYEQCEKALPRSSLIQFGRRQDAEAWEAVFKQISRLKQLSASKNCKDTFS